jgi:gluconolactonase
VPLRELEPQAVLRQHSQEDRVQEHRPGLSAGAVILDARSPRLLELVSPEARVERLASGFTFVEGPVWHPDGFLRFSDIPESTRWRWEPGHGATVDRRPSGKSNGLAYDARLSLIVCEHATSLVVRELPGDEREIVASHFEGKELNSPNDVVVARDGSILFTDPVYGRASAAYGIERPQQLGFQGVYRVPFGRGDPVLLTGELEMPNGLCFSPDETRLYVNDSMHCLIRAYDVRPDGSLAGGRLFAEGITTGDRAHGVTDGMKCDEHGHVWVTGPFGVWVFDPDGEHLGVVRVPEKTANLNWGGPGWSDLYLTSSTSLYRVPTLVRGARCGYMGP